MMASKKLQHPKVLFICKGNWVRSQIAEAIYNKLTNSEDATSAGTYTGAPDEPEGMKLIRIMPMNFFETLEAHGLNLRQKTTRKLTRKMLDEAEVAVCMAEDPFVPEWLESDPKVIWWTVSDTQPTEDTYQKLRTLVSKLVAELHS